MITLAGGTPDTSALPQETVAGMVPRILVQRGPGCCRAAPGPGPPPRLVELICELMAPEGARATPDRIQVTAGSRTGPELVPDLFCDPGDVVVAEGIPRVGEMLRG